jgi:hypothetical protein
MLLIRCSGSGSRSPHTINPTPGSQDITPLTNPAMPYTTVSPHSTTASSLRSGPLIHITSSGLTATHSPWNGNPSSMCFRMLRTQSMTMQPWAFLSVSASRELRSRYPALSEHSYEKRLSCKSTKSLRGTASSGPCIQTHAWMPTLLRLIKSGTTSSEPS